MYDAFFEDRQRIPEGNYYDLRYETLERDPEASLRTVYASLGLPGVDPFLTAVRTHLAANGGYEKNGHSPLPPAVRDRIASEWKRSFEEWGYPV
jgi:hypothetical protein